MSTTHNADDDGRTDDDQNETTRHVARTDVDTTDRRTAEELADVGLEPDKPGDVHREVVQRLGQLLAEHDHASAEISGDAGLANRAVNVDLAGSGCITRTRLERHGLKFQSHFMCDGTVSLECTDDTEGDR